MKYFLKNLLLSILFLCSISVNARLLDVIISLDASEENEQYPITSGVGLSLCQKSSPIITTSHIFYNIMKARQKGNKNFASINIDRDWDVYRTKAPHDFYLFIPKEYVTKNKNRYYTAAFIQEVTRLKLPYLSEEVLLGFRISNFSNVLEKITIAQFNTLQKIENIKHNYFTINIDPLSKILVLGRDEIFGQWNVVLDGHGYYPSDQFPPNLTMNDILNKFQGAGASLVSLSLEDFRDLIQFLIKQLNVNFLYYLTCFAGDINLILPYATVLEDYSGKIIGGLEKPNFTVAVGALTSQSVYVNKRDALEKCINNLDIPKGHVNYKLFFELLNKYSKADSITPTIFKTKELQEILTAVTPRSKNSSDPYGISALPSVMFPKTDIFRAFPLDDRITVISNVVVKKHELEKSPIKLKSISAILIYPSNISVPIQLATPLIGWGQLIEPPSIVSMIPGLSLNKLESFESTININDFMKYCFATTQPVFNKYFYFKKLKLNNGSAFRVKDYPDGPLELSDVLISLNTLKSGKDDYTNIKLIFTGPDNAIHTYPYWQMPLPSKKLGNRTPRHHDQFMNAIINYFYLIADKNELRKEFEFESFKKLLSEEELKILDTIEPNPMTNLLNRFPNLKRYPNQLNSSGQLALNIAAGNNDTIAIEKIIEFGGKTNIKDVNGNTPIIIAAKTGAVSAFKLLINRPETNIFEQNKAGENVIKIAKSTNNLQIQQAIINKQVPSWILSSNPNLLTDQKQKNDALFSSIYAGNANAVKLLIQFGANVNARNIYKDTPLIYALNFAKPEMAKILLNYNADPKLKDNYGNDALKIAQRKSYQDIVKIINEKLKPKPQPQPQNMQQRRFNQAVRKINILLNITRKLNAKATTKIQKQRLRKRLNDIKNKANLLKLQNNQGKIPLMVRPDLIPVLKILPKNQARQIVNIKDKQNKTILSNLIDSKYFMNFNFYRILINKGSKPTKRDIMTFRNRSKGKGPKSRKILQLLRKA